MSKNHEEINKYYNYDSLNAVQRLVQTKILRGAKLTAKEIETLCTGFLTNAIYASVIEGDKNYEEAREKSFEIAAQIVIAQGEEIEEQLKKNDEAEVETETLQSDLDDEEYIKANDGW